MFRPIKGVARVGDKTKALVKKLAPGEIAVICHRDMDQVAAESLCQARVSAVINRHPFISGRYPNRGPLFLMERGVLLFELNPGIEVKDWEGRQVEIDPEKELLLLPSGEQVRVRAYTQDRLASDLAKSRVNVNSELEKFVTNTLEYAKNELGLVTGEYEVPEVETPIKGRHALVVVRGKNYHEDLAAIRSYVEELNPVLIGVDGGANALLELGWRPDLIIGDMDSVTDEALVSGAELIVHGYLDGRAPGAERLREMGLNYKVWHIPGTSEDLALLLAYEAGAELIVAVGTHSNMMDFLDKGRPGMASTFLVRLKVGEILVDAKGIYALYKGRPRVSYALPMLVAAGLPLLVIISLTEPFRSWVRLLVMYLQTSLGF
ncbi:MAG: hypothetical protein H0Z38_01545 [Firmicutes bacterium]|nr:hypothetical protein [Bacillota bacterium]